jgi:hypothetical protein
MGGYDGDLLSFQALSYKLPAFTSVYRAIDPLVGQSKEDAMINRTDEQLLDSLVDQADVASLPGATPIV